MSDEIKVTAGKTKIGKVQPEAVEIPDAQGRLWRATGKKRPKLNRFDRAMRAFMTQNDLRAGTLAVVKDKRLVLARGYTFAKELYPTTQPGSVFRIASASKPITCVAIYQLVESGQLELGLKSKVQEILNLTKPDGDPLPEDDLLPSKRTPPEPTDTAGRYFHSVEVQHLLSHSGGWNRGVETEPTHRRDVEVAQAFGRQGPPVDRWEIARFGADRPWHFEPGTKPSSGDPYSNLGYNLLGLVIEEVVRTSYSNAAKNNVFAPIGVHRPALARPFKEQRLPGEVEYHVIPPSSVTSMVHSDGRQVPIQYGGENNDNFASFGGWALAAPDYARLLAELQGSPNNLLTTPAEDLLVWSPRDVGPGVTAVEHGAMIPGSIGYVTSRSDGVSIVVFWNTSRPSYTFEFEKQSFGNHTPVWHMIANELDDDDWPEENLFPELLPAAPMKLPPFKKELHEFQPVPRPLHLPKVPLERLPMEKGVRPR